MKLSDKIILSVVGLTVLILGIDYLHSGPAPSWTQIKKGMTASEIHRLIGPPAATQSVTGKTIETWRHPGLLRSTTLAVLYYNSQSPGTASTVCCSSERILDRFAMWFWCTFIM